MNELYSCPTASALDRQTMILYKSQSEPHGILRFSQSALSSESGDWTFGEIMETTEEMETMTRTRAIVHTLQAIGSLTGGYVQVLPEYAHCPILIGSDRKPIPLAEIVEAIDEFVDHQALHADYPTLSYAQIDGAMAFLRKLAQFNDKQIDFDAQEDRELTTDADLIAALRESINDREMARVLGNDQ